MPGDELAGGECDAHINRVAVYVADDPAPGHVYRQRRAIKLRTAAEWAVFVLAHELQHAYDAENPRRMRKGESERRADAFAARVLRRWRHAARAGATSAG